MRVIDEVKVSHIVTVLFEREQIHNFEADERSIADCPVVLEVGSGVVRICCGEEYVNRCNDILRGRLR